MKLGKIGPVLTAALAIIAGLLLIIFPTASSKTLSYVAGIVFAVWGLVTMVLFFLRQSGNPNGFANGLFFVALGLFMVFRAELIEAIVPYMLGFVMLMGCFMQLQTAVRMQQKGSENALIAALLGAGEVVWAMLLIAQAFGTGKLAYIMQGIGFVLVAVVDLVTRFVLRRPLKKPAAKTE